MGVRNFKGIQGVCIFVIKNALAKKDETLCQKQSTIWKQIGGLGQEGFG